MRVLVVEDERSISGFISQGLSEAGFVVTVEADGRRGLQRALDAEFDAIILDIMLPGMDGLEVLRRVRAAGSPTPVLLLTARDEIDDKVAGLDAGADDYLTKPFAFSELLARTRALLRRPPLQADEVLRMGALELDQRRRSVRLGEPRRQPQRTRVLAARVPAAAPRPGAQPHADRRGGVGPRLRERLQRRGRLHRLPAPQAGRGRREVRRSGRCAAWATSSPSPTGPSRWAATPRPSGPPRPSRRTATTGSGGCSPAAAPCVCG